MTSSRGTRNQDPGPSREPQAHGERPAAQVALVAPAVPGGTVLVVLAGPAAAEAARSRAAG
ncbi:MAG TPA: hypothetical protein VG123_18145, partial [Streptosporangiaceae bacterium]|nr:hypothetical protein [Streptosporangiaceae bacterium]